MLKINLLNSVTERQGGAVSAVDRTVGSPASRLLLMTMAVAFLLVAVVGWDVISTNMAHAEATRQLEEQKQIAAELEVVMKEQKELEDKIKAIDTRIAAIKKLRDEQRGPSAVLTAMRERLAMVPGLYLQSIEQKGQEMTIMGNSPDEMVPTQFGRSLEFSDGLFSNLNISTERKEMTNNMVTPSPTNPDAGKVNVINFTVKTAYTPSKAPGAGNPAVAAATTTLPATTPVQVAKN